MSTEQLIHIPNTGFKDASFLPDNIAEIDGFEIIKDFRWIHVIMKLMEQDSSEINPIRIIESLDHTNCLNYSFVIGYDGGHNRAIAAALLGKPLRVGIDRKDDFRLGYSLKLAEVKITYDSHSLAGREDRPFFNEYFEKDLTLSGFIDYWKDKTNLDYSSVIVDDEGEILPYISLSNSHPDSLRRAESREDLDQAVALAIEKSWNLDAMTLR